MTKYLLNRLLRGLLSVVVVVMLVMILVYSLVDREDIFRNDFMFSKKTGNERIVYKYTSWANYDYLDYVSYSDYLTEQEKAGAITEEQRARMADIGYTADEDTEEVAAGVRAFTEYYESRGYTVERLDAMKSGTKLRPGGAQQLFAHKDKPLINRILKFFSGLITVDNIHRAEGDVEKIGRAHV